MARARLDRPLGVRLRAPMRATMRSANSACGDRIADPKSCQCGEVLKGVISLECKVFGKACTPRAARRPYVSSKVLALLLSVGHPASKQGTNAA